MNGLIFSVSKTYSETTPESASEGDFSNTGFVYKDQSFTLRELIRELEDCSELSSWPVKTPADCHRGIWASTESHITCYRTGTETSESIHIESVNGKPIRPAQLFRLFKLAKLV